MAAVQMSGAEHYREAERHLKWAKEVPRNGDERFSDEQYNLQAAIAHATLAAAAGPLEFATSTDHESVTLRGDWRRQVQIAFPRPYSASALCELIESLAQGGEPESQEGDRHPTLEELSLTPHERDMVVHRAGEQSGRVKELERILGHAPVPADVEPYSDDHLDALRLALADRLAAKGDPATT